MQLKVTVIIPPQHTGFEEIPSFSDSSIRDNLSGRFVQKFCCNILKKPPMREKSHPLFTRKSLALKMLPYVFEVKDSMQETVTAIIIHIIRLLLNH